jgi:hypothetical protein
VVHNQTVQRVFWIDVIGMLLLFACWLSRKFVPGDSQGIIDLRQHRLSPLAPASLNVRRKYEEQDDG